MKTVIYILAAAFSFCINTNALQAQEEGFEGIVHFTPGMSGIAGSRSLHMNPERPFTEKFGFSAGISAKHNISRDLYYKLGLQYSNKGTRYRFIYPTLLNGGFFHTDYIEVICMAGFIPFSEVKNIKIEAGFSVGKLIYANPFFEGSSSDYTLSNTKDFDLCFVTNFLFPFSKKNRDHLSIGPSFSHSLMRINPNYSFYNYTLGLMINYRI